MNAPVLHLRAWARPNSGLNLCKWKTPPISRSGALEKDAWKDVRASENNAFQRGGNLPSLIQKSVQRKEGFGAVTAKLLVPDVLSEMHSCRRNTGDMMPVPATSSTSFSLNFEERRGKNNGIDGGGQSCPLVKVELRCAGENVFETSKWDNW